MKLHIAVPFLFCLVFLSCASHRGSFPDADVSTTIGIPVPDGKKGDATPKSILDRYTLEFKIPDPLADKGSVVNRRVNPSHEGEIYCRATLLDSIATEADIAFQCQKDSLSIEGCDEFKKKYFENHVHPGQFRIRVSMESGFSQKSLDPKHWVMYIMNAKGVMIEPTYVQFTPRASIRDSVYSAYNRIALPRTRIQGDITLYFNRVTFFDEDLLGSANPFILFEMVHDQETEVRVKWKNGKR